MVSMPRVKRKSLLKFTKCISEIIDSPSFNDLVLKVNSQTDENDKYDYKLITLYKNSEKIGKIGIFSCDFSGNMKLYFLK